MNFKKIIKIFIQWLKDPVSVFGDWAGYVNIIIIVCYSVIHIFVQSMFLDIAYILLIVWLTIRLIRSYLPSTLMPFYRRFHPKDIWYLKIHNDIFGKKYYLYEKLDESFIRKEQTDSTWIYYVNFMETAKEVGFDDENLRFFTMPHFALPDDDKLEFLNIKLKYNKKKINLRITDDDIFIFNNRENVIEELS